MPAKLTTLCRMTLAMMFLHTAGVHADCVDTVSLNAQESDFYLRANAVLKSFLLPAPSNESIRTDDYETSPENIEVCEGSKKDGDFTVEVSRKYVWPDPKMNSADTAITLKIAINVPSFDAGEYSGAYGSPSPALSAGLKVNNVQWKLEGSTWGLKAQRDALLASLAAVVERDRMAALVGRPLPSVAESDAISRVESTQLITPEPAATATATPPSAAPASAPTGALKDAANTVQKLRELRGLFGR